MCVCCPPFPRPLRSEQSDDVLLGESGESPPVSCPDPSRSNFPACSLKRSNSFESMLNCSLWLRHRSSNSLTFAWARKRGTGTKYGTETNMNSEWCINIYIERKREWQIRQEKEWRRQRSKNNIYGNIYTATLHTTDIKNSLENLWRVRISARNLRPKWPHSQTAEQAEPSAPPLFPISVGFLSAPFSPRWWPRV